MRQLPYHCASGHALAAAAPAPRIILSDSAFQDRPVTTDQLAGDDEPERIEQAETVEVRTGESRLEHVEVFRVEGVGTSIIGRPRLLSSHRHAAAPRPCLYTLKYEDPLQICLMLTAFAEKYTLIRELS